MAELLLSVASRVEYCVRPGVINSRWVSTPQTWLRLFQCEFPMQFIYQLTLVSPEPLTTLFTVCSNCAHLCHVPILLSPTLPLIPLSLIESRLALLFPLAHTSVHYSLPPTSNIRCVQHGADATGSRVPFTDRCAVSDMYCAVIVRCIVQY